MAGWRDELVDAVKSKAEREAEEVERHKKRVSEALTAAESALSLSADALRFTGEKLKDKEQPVEISEEPDKIRLSLRDVSVTLELVRESAVVRITFGDGKPREFDFAKDRHIAPPDVEEYIGRRALEFVRAAQKATPW
ncbi:hypothetical protein [Chondromyces apiculatus]|uniref:Uncharacterized protein n=1 Tax=Chondromyces apiculatus DSM 436 TaxID=1192034 RepID=A0A017TAU6_9BACT|nr:hypothetical protein [Chondromyces apiculatus]EYF05945.1 Hypothetical protein CAP_2404 [Chondromyces apiculatus DSM 436]